MSDAKLMLRRLVGAGGSFWARSEPRRLLILLGVGYLLGCRARRMPTVSDTGFAQSGGRWERPIMGRETAGGTGVLHAIGVGKGGRLAALYAWWLPLTGMG